MIHRSTGWVEGLTGTVSFPVGIGDSFSDLQRVLTTLSSGKATASFWTILLIILYGYRRNGGDGRVKTLVILDIVIKKIILKGKERGNEGLEITPCKFRTIRI